MAEGARLVPDLLQSLSYGGIITEGFINVAVFVQPVRLLLIQNLTDQLVVFSFDGHNSHLILPSCGNFTMDIATNRGTPQTMSLPVGYGIGAKALDVEPTTGSVYVSYFYAQ